MNQINRKNEFLTLDDFDLKSKKVLVRVDINCPVDSETKKITDNERIKRHANTTIKELVEKGARVIVMSHQGRPGNPEFISLREHAQNLSKLLNTDVKFVDSVFGSKVREEIEKIKDGEVMVVENVRFYSEELINRPGDALSKTHLVRDLSGSVDYFINDAFAAIHRSQASLVGFGYALPTMAGRVIEDELKALNKIFDNSRKPVVFVLGGVKVKESLKVIRSLMSNKKADMVLTGGLLANLLLVARGYDIGNDSVEFLKGKGIYDLLPEAEYLIKHYDEKIETPVDVALADDERHEVSVSELPVSKRIVDVGRETVGRYCKILETAKTIIMNSPLGQYEKENYSYGTTRILHEIAKHDAYTVIGGGHAADMVNRLGLADKFNHVSCGGRATLYYLAGESTPVIEMLREAKERYTKSYSNN